MASQEFHQHLTGAVIGSGGRGAGVDKSQRAEKGLGVEKGSSKPQNPRRPLHALLAHF